MTESRRLVSGRALDEDARIEATVRPANFGDYIGQGRVKENLQIAVEAARNRGEALDYVLLYAPPDLIAPGRAWLSLGSGRVVRHIHV